LVKRDIDLFHVFCITHNKFVDKYLDRRWMCSRALAAAYPAACADASPSSTVRDWNMDVKVYSNYHVGLSWCIKALSSEWKSRDLIKFAVAELIIYFLLLFMIFWWIIVPFMLHKPYSWYLLHC
jgi:hypothetical protein